MGKCLNCGLEVEQHDGKRNKLYCNEACRKQYARKGQKQVDLMKSEATARSVVDERQAIGTKPYPDAISGQTNSGHPLPDVIVAIPGQCWCCGNDIGPGLVCCGPCAWSGKAKEKRAGRYPPLLTDRTPKQMEVDLRTPHLTGYEMTATERANYKPADQLGKGEHNHVSKPGDADYDGVCTPEWIEEHCGAGKA